MGAASSSRSKEPQKSRCKPKYRPPRDEERCKIVDPSIKKTRCEYNVPAPTVAPPRMPNPKYNELKPSIEPKSTKCDEAEKIISPPQCSFCSQPNPKYSEIPVATPSSVSQDEIQKMVQKSKDYPDRIPSDSED